MIDLLLIGNKEAFKMNSALAIAIICVVGVIAEAAGENKTTDAPPPTQAPTTLAPTTKPTLAPTPKPTEKPKPILAFEYTLKDSNGPCVLLKLGARIEQGKEIFDLPKNANVTGTCGSDIQLVFAEKTLKISFAKTDEDKKWEVSDFSVIVANTTTVFKDNNTKTYKVNMDEAFSCRTVHKIVDGDMTLTVKEFQMQPFVKGDKYGRVIHCEADKAANNVVPIAVGAALALLVIIVLVLYLIGRQKHQKGYQTV